MAIVRKNKMLNGVSGKVGETHYYREIYGQQQMVQLPGERSYSSEKQRLNETKLKLTASYATTSMKDPEVKKLHTKAIDARARSAWHVAVRDYLNPPIVHYIKTDLYKGAIGDVITIKATDTFDVERVLVKIISAAGKVIEKGGATRYVFKPKMIWKYKASVANARTKGTVVEVTAFDRPGNETSLRVTCE